MLANHAEFDPLEQAGGMTTPFKIDIAAIKAAAASLALPGQVCIDPHHESHH